MLTNKILFSLSLLGLCLSSSFGLESNLGCKEESIVWGKPFDIEYTNDSRPSNTIVSEDFVLPQEKGYFKNYDLTSNALNSGYSNYNDDGNIVYGNLQSIPISYFNSMQDTVNLNVTSYPFSSIGLVNFVYSHVYCVINGRTCYASFPAYGTGFITSNSTVLTCAHILYADPTVGDYDDGIVNYSFPSTIRFLPGFDLNHQSVGDYFATNAIISKEYYDNPINNFDYDFGVLKFSNNSFQNFDKIPIRTNTLLNSTTKLMIDGYWDPENHSFNQYYCGGHVIQNNTYQYVYSCIGKSGFSGSPVFSSTGYAIGIHTWYNDSTNQFGGTIINNRILSLMEHFL